MIYVFLADGFEVTEALATVDVLRRANLPVTTVGIGSEEITSSHGITVLPDVVETDLDFEDMTAIVLPGGMPGTLNLEKSEIVINCVKHCYENDKIVAAICAAPSILGHLGMLEGRKATCFPGFESELYGASHTTEHTATDGKVITGKGAGCAIEFGHAIVTVAISKEIADKVIGEMQCL